MNDLIPLKVAAEILGVSHEAVRRLGLRGTLPVVKRDGFKFVSKEMVEMLRDSSGYKRRSRRKTGRAA